MMSPTPPIPTPEEVEALLRLPDPPHPMMHANAEWHEAYAAWHRRFIRARHYPHLATLAQRDARGVVDVMIPRSAAETAVSALDRVLGDTDPEWPDARVTACQQISAALAAAPVESEGVTTVEKIEMVSYETGFRQPVEPMWRVNYRGRCYDLESEAIAHLLVAALSTHGSALREPTPEMIQAAYDVHVRWHPTRSMFSDGEIAEMWTAMLDAAPPAPSPSAGRAEGTDGRREG